MTRRAFTRAIVRPVLAYTAAVLAAGAFGAVMLLGALHHWSHAPIMQRAAMNAAMDLSLVILAIMPLPVIALAWLAHLSRAPRPWTDIAAGAAFGPLLTIAIFLIMTGAVADFDASDYAMMTVLSAAGALGGLVYGLIAGGRRP